MQSAAEGLLTFAELDEELGARLEAAAASWLHAAPWLEAAPLAGSRLLGLQNMIEFTCRRTRAGFARR